MNTITDLQAHFFRVYGALESEESQKATSSTAAVNTAPTPALPHRHFQCRAGMANASQCDLFHLGQMTRFFAMRAKTIFLGSNLIDPDSISDNYDELDGGNGSEENMPPGAPSDITAILASMKQFPDYQIDSNHQACGVRRRLLPILPCIDKYLLDSRSLLGVRPCPSDRRRRHWARGPSYHTVDIRFSKILSIHYPAGNSRWANPTTTSDEAASLFTARKRNWEA